MKHNCEKCPMRAKYDKKPQSLAGKFWRWHINFCPGWRAFFLSRSPKEKDELRAKYSFNKYLK